MIKNVFRIAFITIILPFVVTAQSKEAIIAEIGNDKITATEFRAKYELMPHISPNNYSIDSMKNEFLYSLIAEKLWAKEADAKGLGNNPIILDAFEPLERLYVKDALFKEEVEKKVKVTNQDVITGVIRKKTIIKANVISSTDSTEIANLHKRFSRGASFDSTLMFRPEFNDQEKPLEFTFGVLEDENVENMLYSLKPESISKPVKTKHGWFIFKVKDKIFNNTGEDDKITSEVKKTIKERRTKEVGEKFLASFLPKAKVDINGNLFNGLSYSFFKILSDKANKDTVKQNEYYLTEVDLANFVNSSDKEFLKSILVAYSKNNSTIQQFINYLMFEGFKISRIEENIITSKLKKSLDFFIQQELLYLEGVKRGYHELPEIKKELNTWKESYTAQLLRNDFLDSVNVSDDEVLSYYNKILNQPDSVNQVNIIEILTDKLENIEIILNELDKGKDFKDLAAKYNQREWTKKANGEYGLFPINMHGEIGKIASTMKLNEVYGPVKVAEGYSLIKLIDKKESEKKITKTFKEMKAQLVNDLKSSKLENLFDDYTVKLANKFGLKINPDVVNSIKLTKVNMFTYRYMGFGGRISATPYISPNYKWSEKLKSKKLTL